MPDPQDRLRRQRARKPSHAGKSVEAGKIFVFNDTMNRVPSGVRAVAALFSICAAYLGVLGALMLVRPGTISMATGAPLLFGLELAGPYMFLLMALLGGAVAWGLVNLNNIARHAATLMAIAGVVMLVPPVSAATVLVQPKPLVIGGLGIIIRVVVAWYLSRADVAEHFRSPQVT